MSGEGWIDIHCHILPGVDDGARSLEESVAMARSAAEQGIGAIIATPHQKPDRRCVSAASARERTEQLRKVLDGLSVPVKLFDGGEILCSMDTTELLERGRAGTLAGSSYVLTEFWPQEEWSYIRAGLGALLSAGYRPVLAHVERYLNVIRDFDRIDELRSMGCCIQVNAGSVTGFGGSQMKRAARRILKEELADLVATDAHRAAGSRAVNLADCAAWLQRRCSRSYTDRLLRENAAHILDNTEMT